MDVLGLVLVLIFYGAILLAGVWVAQRQGLLHPKKAEDLMLAGRNFGLTVGIFTLVATEVGGAFVNGTAEEVYNRGLLWCIAPMGYSLSMTLNAWFFVRQLSDAKCVTCIDALQKAYGSALGGLVYLPSCLGDVCWTAAVLSALGSTLSVILQIEQSVTVTVSAAIAIVYTLLGGMYSVAYTDVIQLVFIFVGLWTAIPFMLSSEQADVNSLSLDQWTGTVTSTSWVSYLDFWLLCVCGGIPWQPYYQRALAVRTVKQARILSMAATILCLVCMVPPVLIGGVAKTVDWSNTTHFEALSESSSVVLPVALAQLVPYPVAMGGLAAVSAAAMSSVDSSLLSGASYLTHNIYAGFIRPSDDQDTGKSMEYIMAFRVFVVILGAMATLLSLNSSSIYGLWVLAGDLGYVVVFPQFLAAVHFPQWVNSAGSLTAAIVVTVLRFLIGEPLIELPGAITFPDFGDPDSNPVLPVKTILMLISLVLLVATSWVSRKVVTKIHDHRRRSQTEAAAL